MFKIIIFKAPLNKVIGKFYTAKVRFNNITKRLIAFLRKLYPAYHLYPTDAGTRKPVYRRLGAKAACQLRLRSWTAAQVPGGPDLGLQPSYKLNRRLDKRGVTLVPCTGLHLRSIGKPTARRHSYALFFLKAINLYHTNI